MRDDKLWTRFPFTRRVVEQAEAQRDGEDLRLGFSLLRALAESDDTLVEIAPHVWRQTGGRMDERYAADSDDRCTRDECADPFDQA